MSQNENQEDGSFKLSRRAFLTAASAAGIAVGTGGCVTDSRQSVSPPLPDGGRVLLSGKDPKLVFKAHNGIVTSLAFSPDSKFLVASSAVRETKLWRIPEGTPMGRLSEMDGPFGCLAFSLDGKTLATGGGGIRLWTVPEGTPKGPAFSETTGAVSSVAFAKDGKTIVAAVNGKVLIVEALDGAVLKKIDSDTRLFGFVSPNGDTALALDAATKGMVRYSLPDGKELSSPDTPAPFVQHAAFSPDGKQLAWADRGSAVHLWHENAATEALTGNSRRINTVAFSPDRQYVASGGQDGSVRLWSVADGQRIRTLEYFDPYEVTALAFSPDGQFLAAGGANGLIVLCEMRQPYSCWGLCDKELLEEGQKFSPRITRSYSIRSGRNGLQ